ncbi:MAG: hypothetical protein AMXMBFR84_44740 [Candidatus Hydrogenedentota bacterium]
MRHFLPVALLSTLVGLSANAQAAVDISQTIPKGLRFMEEKSLAWKEKMGCASCHHVPMMLWSAYEAKKHGYEVKESVVESMRAWVLQDDNASGVFPPKESPPDRDGTQIASIYVLHALEAGPGGWEDSSFAKQTAEHFLALQQPDGSWPPFPSSGRSPILEGNGISTRFLLAALAALPGRATDPNVATAVDKAALAVSAMTPISHQAKVLQLLAEVRTGADDSSIQAHVAKILAMQRVDGSWAQTPEMFGDAYATGQTLYALAQTGVKVDHPAIKRAARFLVESQSEDGSWPMISRPIEAGGREAHNLEPIVAMATGWALLGLLAVS